MNQDTIPLHTKTWTLLTETDVTALTFQARGGAIEIRFTTDTTAPGYNAAGLFYPDGEGETMRTIADLVALSGAVRAWARPAGEAADIFVDHA